MANQNQTFLAALVEHTPVDALGTEDKQYWIEKGTELAHVLGKVLRRNLVATAVVSALLTPIATVSLPATTQAFVAAEKFTTNISSDAEVKIAFLGANFINGFLADGGKIELPQVWCELRCAKLTKSSIALPIIVELGCEQAETRLTHVWGLLRKQANGGKGALLTNGHANIFFVRDRQGVLCVVAVHWFDNGWHLVADSVGSLNVLTSGHQVLSCD